VLATTQPSTSLGNEMSLMEYISPNWSRGGIGGVMFVQWTKSVVSSNDESVAVGVFSIPTMPSPGRRIAALTIGS